MPQLRIAQDGLDRRRLEVPGLWRRRVGIGRAEEGCLMPYTEVKVRVRCKCAEVGEDPAASCKMCEGSGWIESWESFHGLLVNYDVTFEPGMD